MIHIIGTAHSTQSWSDAIRNGTSLDASVETVRCFDVYLRDIVLSLGATLIAEESNASYVERLQGGSSVAKGITEELGLRHVYCDPDQEERTASNIQTAEDREQFWVVRLQEFSPNSTSIIFICGADHSLSFRSALKRNCLHARIHRQDWTLG